MIYDKETAQLMVFLGRLIAVDKLVSLEN